MLLMDLKSMAVQRHGSSVWLKQRGQPVVPVSLLSESFLDWKNVDVVQNHGGSGWQHQ